MKNTLLKKKYLAKKASTANRVDKNGDKILFLLTFEEWCKLWDDMNLMPMYPWVVSRRNDLGNYEAGNVFIQHNIQNTCDAHGLDSEYEQKITEWAIRTKYKRGIVKRLVLEGKINI